MSDTHNNNTEDIGRKVSTSRTRDLFRFKRPTSVAAVDQPVPVPPVPKFQTRPATTQPAPPLIQTTTFLRHLGTGEHAEVVDPDFGPIRLRHPITVNDLARSGFSRTELAAIWQFLDREFKKITSSTSTLHEDAPNSYFARLQSSQAIRISPEERFNNERAANRRPWLERIITPETVTGPGVGNEDEDSLINEAMPVNDDTPEDVEESLESRLDDLRVHDVEDQVTLERARVDITLTRLQIQMRALTTHAEQLLRDAHDGSDLLRSEDYASDSGSGSIQPEDSMSTKHWQRDRVPRRSPSEGHFSFRHPFQLLRNIVIPRRNSRRRRLDLYPSDDSVRRPLPRRNVAGTLPAIGDVNARPHDEDNISPLASGIDVVEHTSQSHPSLGPYTSLGSRPSFESAPPPSRSSRALPTYPSVLDARWNTWLATQSPSPPPSGSSQTSNDDLSSAAPSGSRVDFLQRAREYNRNRQFYLQDELQSLHSSAISLPERRVEENINESEVWTTASTGSASMSSESGLPESLLRRREAFYHRGRTEPEDFIPSDSLNTDALLDEIIDRGSDFFFEGIGLFGTHDTLLFDSEAEGEEAANEGWKKKDCGMYRSGWTGDGA